MMLTPDGDYELPESVPYGDFVAHLPREVQEQLAPGLTSPDGWQHITEGPDGRPHVKLKERRVPANAVTPEFQQALAVGQLVQQAAGGEPQPVLVPLGELVRRYGVETVNAMYPGIFQSGGFQPFLQRYGTDKNGQLRVPDPTAYSPAMQAPPPMMGGNVSRETSGGGK